MTNEETALRANFLEQTRQGKMSLITLLHNLPGRSSSHLPDLRFDENDRYVPLNEDHRLFDHVRDPSWQAIERDRTSIYGILQQRTRSVLPLASSQQRYDRLGHAFHLTSEDVGKQYELALKNRLEIPPILMRRLVIDAIGVLRIMIDELQQRDIEQNDERLRRISQRRDELEICNQLFARHC